VIGTEVTLNNSATIIPPIVGRFLTASEIYEPTFSRLEAAPTRQILPFEQIVLNLFFHHFEFEELVLCPGLKKGPY
jgi:hypothetical protein